MDKGISRVAEHYKVNIDTFKNEIVPAHRPVVLRGIAKDWPAVICGRESSSNLLDYLKKIDKGHSVILSHGKSSMDGRFFYDKTFNGFNFGSASISLVDALDKILDNYESKGNDTFYIGNAPIKHHIPDFLLENNNNLLAKSLNPGFWVGTKLSVATHFDVPDNIACCITGHRRFTLFPPEQISNLYVGPIDNTPAGQPISLVEVKKPDFVRYPRFREALRCALIADLGPGDAIYIPSLWWHNVESLDPINLLVNYFHDATPRHFDSGFNCLMHAMMSIRNLPEEKRNAWRVYFEHYIFADHAESTEHIPQFHLGILGNQTSEVSEKLRNIVTNNLMDKC